MKDLKKILKKVAEKHNVNYSDITGACRDRCLVELRMFYVFCIRNEFQIDLKTIGKSLNRDHSTIIHHITTIREIEHLNIEKEFISKLNEFKNWFNAEIVFNPEYEVFQKDEQMQKNLLYELVNIEKQYQELTEKINKLSICKFEILNKLICLK